MQLAGPLGSVVLPVGVADLADGTVWAPASAPGLSVRHLVGPAGSPVSVTYPVPSAPPATTGTTSAEEAS